MKKHLLCLGTALMTAACFTACDDSGSGSSSSIKVLEFGKTSEFPEECENAEVAKVAEDYYACYENEWVKVADSALVEKIKDGLDDELVVQIEEFLAENVKKSPESSSASEKDSKGKGDGKSSSSSVKGDSLSSSSSQDCKDKKCEEESSEKCGDTTYDPSTQVCEKGKVLKKCGRRYTYDPETQVCDDGYVWGKCGDATYDLDDQICEKGKVLGKCGENVTYDPETQVCEGDEVLEKCSEGVGYNPKNQKCEKGKVLKKCGENDYYDPDIRTCENGVIKGRCGEKGVYDLETKFCKGSDILEKCGENDGYDPAEQYCKGDTTVEPLSVCGTGTNAQKYNPEESYCSEENDVTPLETCGTYKYNPLEEYCIDKIKTEKWGVCGTGEKATKYKPTESFCARYDGIDERTYKYVVFDTLTWMAENVDHYVDQQSPCYNNTDKNCENYGRLYSYYSANAACPDGWRLPTAGEFGSLLHDKPSKTTVWDWLHDGGSSSGFNALLAGRRHTVNGAQKWEDLGINAYFWTSYVKSNDIYFVDLKYNESNTSSILDWKLTIDYTSHLLSVRCVKDENE